MKKNEIMCKITNIIFHVNIMLRKLFELITHSKHETNERDLIFIIFLYIYIFTDSIIYIYIYGYAFEKPFPL